MSRIVLVLSVVLALGACREPAPQAGTSTTSTPTPSNAARHEIRVDASGYHPATVEVQAGVPVTLVFTRTSDEGCGQQLSFPSLGIRKDLPLDTPIEVSFTPERGEVTFTCGMDMLRGAVVVQ